jgi:integrase
MGDWFFRLWASGTAHVGEYSDCGLRRMAFGAEEKTAHGTRAMASTLLNESGKWHPDAIERALRHRDGDQVRAAIIAAHTGASESGWRNGGASILAVSG